MKKLPFDDARDETRRRQPRPLILSVWIARGLRLPEIVHGGKRVLVPCPFHRDTRGSAVLFLESERFFCRKCRVSLSALELCERLGLRLEDLFTRRRGRATRLPGAQGSGQTPG